jgi:hypothetical protein
MDRRFRLAEMAEEKDGDNEGGRRITAQESLSGRSIPTAVIEHPFGVPFARPT